MSRFFKQNSRQLKRNLGSVLEEINNSPTVEQLHQCEQLLLALDILEQHFSRYFTTLDVEKIRAKVHAIFVAFSTQTLEKTDVLMEAMRYRQVLDALRILSQFQPLTLEQKKLYEGLQAYLPRRLWINKIRVNDALIERLVKDQPDDYSRLYGLKGLSLMEGAVNVPLEFSRDLDHYLNKESSRYLALASEHSQAQYRLDCSVGVEMREDLLETREEITEMFQVKFNQDAYWHDQPLVYEVFHKQVQYSVSVQGAVYLQLTNDVIGYFSFETLVNVDDYRLGGFIDFNTEIIDIVHTAKYKEYAQPAIIKTADDYFNQAIDDAAAVLATRVLNAIDFEPEPYALVVPFNVGN